MLTFASLFAGGGGADIGAMMAGLTPIWGVDYSPEIAKWHQRNIPGRTICADVSDVDYASLERSDVLWASPPCPSFSIANANRGETEEDQAAALAVCRAIETLLPPWFLLENVTQYAGSQSFMSICSALDRGGYWYAWSNENAATHGVPQTRRCTVSIESEAAA